MMSRYDDVKITWCQDMMVMSMGSVVEQIQDSRLMFSSFNISFHIQLFMKPGPGRPSAGGPRMDRRAVTCPGVVKISCLALRLRRSARRGPEPRQRDGKPWLTLCQDSVMENRNFRDWLCWAVMRPLEVYSVSISHSFGNKELTPLENIKHFVRYQYQYQNS